MDPKKKYDEGFAAMLMINRYFAAVPFYRQEQLQLMLGVPLPASTQWEILKSYEPVLEYVYDALVKADRTDLIGDGPNCLIKARGTGYQGRKDHGKYKGKSDDKSAKRRSGGSSSKGGSNSSKSDSRSNAGAGSNPSSKHKSGEYKSSDANARSTGKPAGKTTGRPAKKKSSNVRMIEGAAPYRKSKKSSGGGKPRRK